MRNLDAIKAFGSLDIVQGWANQSERFRRLKEYADAEKLAVEGWMRIRVVMMELVRVRAGFGKG